MAQAAQNPKCVMNISVRDDCSPVNYDDKLEMMGENWIIHDWLLRYEPTWLHVSPLTIFADILPTLRIDAHRGMSKRMLVVRFYSTIWQMFTIQDYNHSYIAASIGFSPASISECVWRVTCRKTRSIQLTDRQSIIAMAPRILQRLDVPLCTEFERDSFQLSTMPLICNRCNLTLLQKKHQANNSLQDMNRSSEIIVHHFSWRLKNTDTQNYSTSADTTHCRNSLE